MRLIKIGVANVNATVGAVRSNTDRVLELGRRMAVEGVTLGRLKGLVAERIATVRADELAFSRDLKGQRCRLLGRVSMDSICIEIDDLQAAAGDRAVLWGRELSVDEVARHSGMISYELLCHAGAAGRS